MYGVGHFVFYQPKKYPQQGDFFSKNPPPYTLLISLFLCYNISVG